MMGPELHAEIAYRQERVRKVFAAGRIPARAAELERLRKEREVAEEQHRRRPWDHDAEIQYLRADEAYREKQNGRDDAA